MLSIVFNPHLIAFRTYMVQLIYTKLIYQECKFECSPISNYETLYCSWIAICFLYSIEKDEAVLAPSRIPYYYWCFQIASLPHPEAIMHAVYSTSCELYDEHEYYSNSKHEFLSLPNWIDTIPYNGVSFLHSLIKNPCNKWWKI